MLRRTLFVAFAFVVPAVGAATVNGCGSSEPPVEDLCGWLAGPNCYSDFYADVGAQCGALGAGNGPKGSFLTRDKLDLCVLAPPQGGQVIFDPPLDVKALPPATVSFTMLSNDGNECGKGSFAGSSFSVTIDPYPPDAGVVDDTTASSTTSATTGVGGAGGASGTGGAGGTGTTGATTSSSTTTGAGGSGQVIAGGTFSSTTPAGRAVFDTLCPNGESHHFDRFQLSSAECTTAALAPRAELVTSPGGVTNQGHVIFRVYYPPANGGDQPDVVEYFDCAIPEAPKPCVDGVQDGAETDIDCGGSSADCARCPDGAKCADASDCSSGICAYDKGFKKCMPAAM
jgi:hypothetical protein